MQIVTTVLYALFLIAVTCGLFSERDSIRASSELIAVFLIFRMFGLSFPQIEIWPSFLP